MLKYFAKIENNIVTQVVIINDASVTTEAEGQAFLENQYKDGATWLETFIDGSSRANMASTDDIYDSENNVFYKKQPFNSWILNRTNWQWEPPVPMPESSPGVLYMWNELTLSWDLI
jgi:hypothetical protein